MRSWKDTEDPVGSCCFELFQPGTWRSSFIICLHSYVLTFLHTSWIHWVAALWLGRCGQANGDGSRETVLEHGARATEPEVLLALLLQSGH